MSDVITLELLDRALESLFRKRDIPRERIDFMCGPNEAALIGWIFEEHIAETEWLRMVKAKWWAILTPEQQRRETRRAQVYFKLECQWSRKSLPLPGDVPFVAHYQHPSEELTEEELY